MLVICDNPDHCEECGFCSGDYDPEDGKCGTCRFWDAETHEDPCCRCTGFNLWVDRRRIYGPIL